MVLVLMGNQILNMVDLVEVVPDGEIQDTVEAVEAFQVEVQVVPVT